MTVVQRTASSAGVNFTARLQRGAHIGMSRLHRFEQTVTHCEMRSNGG